MIHSKEFDESSSYGSPPLKAFTLPHAKTSQDFSNGISSSSLPKDTSIVGNVFTDTKVTNEPELSNVTAKSIDGRGKRGKNTNLYALYHGLKELRCLLQLVPPGTVPDDTMVGALMDLVSVIYIFLDIKVLRRLKYLFHVYIVLAIYDHRLVGNKLLNIFLID